jgi:HAD superfamily hydrolase (TIGR01509 family)
MLNEANGAAGTAGPAVARLAFDAVLLDVDGTLIDSNAAHAQAWSEALREHGIDAGPEVIRPLVGMGGDKLLPKVAGVAEGSERGKALAARKKAIFEQLLPALQPTTGARALLDYLRSRDIELVIATSAGEEEMHGLLQRAGVDDLIPQRTSKDDAESSKPDPDIVHAALNRTRAARGRTVMIGDTPYDIEAAARAGVACIALRCGGHWSDEELIGAMAIYDDPASLLAAWQAR